MIDYELLMPAGDFEKMQYAFAFGADAAYLGIPRFSLRARENGFKTLDQVVEAVDYAHAIDKKVYVTANILPHNSKVEPCIEYIGRTLERCKPDAWIMSDPGLIMLMREKYPDQVIHISVQANTVNYASAQFWRKMGAGRIILSRELNVREIKEIRNAADDMELEAFVHGAICIAYSGRCLISTYLTGRDPNQGTCTNSCRWKYKIFRKDNKEPGREYVPLKDEFYLEESERPGEFLPIDEDENGAYLMNARDLCVIEHLDELHAAGVNSFKVEGRSKSLYYVAMIARAYRRAIDDLKEGKSFNPENLRDIFATSNRSLTTGFIHGSPGAAGQKYDVSGSLSSSHRFTGVVRDYDPGTKMVKVEPRNAIHKGASYELCSPNRDCRIVVEDLFDEKGKPVDQIHGGMPVCSIPIDDDPGPFAVLREQLDDDATGRFT
ncbi:MAG: U32 family peptidase C-terminal domain-containing protein [Phycisphaerae bacterium]|jgi:putative protease|nr:U32 family peptidase C-terminal domain-containing protein [Phycisphaerae bacterium]